MSAIGRVLCILFGACALARAGEIRTLTAKKACWLREKQNQKKKQTGTSYLPKDYGLARQHSLQGTATD